MCLIPKKGGLNLAKNHRGILLVASIAKRMHGLLRSQLMRKLQTKRLEGQIGGIPGSDGPIWLPLSSDVDAAI